jgi:hypothetical protein
VSSQSACCLTCTAVIGERIVTPQALVHLVMKLRIFPPKSVPASEANGEVGTENRPTVDADEEARLDNAFLNNPKDVEDLKSATSILGSAHAPLWPSVCCLFHTPVVLADTDKCSEPQAQLVDRPR